MKVIYDISAFGQAEVCAAGRAGIYRVVGSLAKALMNTGRCSIRFSAWESDWHDYTLKHLQSHAEYRDDFLPYYPNSKTYRKLNRLFTRAHARVSTASGFKKIGWKSARKLMQFSSELFNPDTKGEINLLNASIFHSPYYPIPQKVRQQKKQKLFLTVYDLIPILYPNLFETPKAGTEHYLKTIVDGIGREDWVVCISERTKEDLCTYRKDIDPRRVFVTPLGASEWFYPCQNPAIIETVRAKYKIPTGQYLLSVCTLEPRKNLAHLIHCFIQLIRQEPLNDLRLVLAGGLGWKYETIFAELTGNDETIRNRIVFTGRLADEDMAALYSGAIAFVYPSLYEGFGLPPLEAMQCGTPVITSNTSSLPEVVGHAGIMVDPRDADGLCQAMLQLATKTDLRQALAQKSLEQAKLFSWAHCANQTLAAYETAVNSTNK